MVLPIRISLAPGPAAKTRPAAIGPAIAAKISAVATLRRPTGRSRRIASLANGNLNSNACQAMSIIVRIVAPHASSHPVQVLVHFLGEHFPKQRGTKSRHYPPTLCLDWIDCVSRRAQTLGAGGRLHLRLFAHTARYVPGRSTRESYLRGNRRDDRNLRSIQATDVG